MGQNGRQKVRGKNYNCVRNLREWGTDKTTLIGWIEVLAGEQLCATDHTDEGGIS